MKIGELFVEIGTKGAEVTTRSLGAVGSALKNTTSLSLQTKAALLAVFYEVNKFAKQSANAGLGLQQFQNLTGLDAIALQKWSYALQQSGVSADETAATFKRLQGAMSDIILNGNIPAGFKAIAETVHLDPTRLRDTFYVFDKLREYARTHKNNPDMTRALLAPTLGSDSVVQALMSGTFDPNATPRGQMYGDSQIKSLAKVQVGLTNLRTKVEHEFGKFTAKWGPQGIKDLDMLSNSVFKLADAFAALLDKLHAVELINHIFEGWSEIFKDSAALVEGVASKKKGSFTGMFGDSGTWKVFLHSMLGDPIQVPKVRPMQGPTTLNQNVNIYGAHKPEESGQHAKKEFHRAYRQLKDGRVD